MQLVPYSKSNKSCMLAGGGLPKRWTEKMIAAQQIREAA